MQNELSPNHHEARPHEKIWYSLVGQISGISWTPKNSFMCSKALISGSYLQTEETSPHHSTLSNKEIQ